MGGGGCVAGAAVMTWRVTVATVTVVVLIIMRGVNVGLMSATCALAVAQGHAGNPLAAAAAGAEVQDARA